ncbi:hypothetical protein V498_07989 [Pseudogymnoascus sp. VKM F-4517 (FW-2822)]|nr:hypothetical protein V498_07989 [Pseudogymnoascus sp. VKM F-4517 (FW-2822)]
MQGQNILPSYLQVPRIVVTKPDDIDPVDRRHQDHSGECYSSREGASHTRISLPSTPPKADVNEYLHIPGCPETRNSPEPDKASFSTPIISKFSENFDEPGSKSSFRGSLLSAMRLSGLGRIAKSFDGDNYVDSIPTEGQSSQNKMKPTKKETPTRTTSRKETVSLDRSMNSSMESAEIMWTKAFRQSIYGASGGAESGERDTNPASKRSKPDGKANNANKQRSERASTDGTDNSRRSSQSIRSSSVIPPESWANFPSHTRESRCGSTETENSFARSDFAIRELLDGLHKDTAATKKPQHEHRQDLPQHHLPGRLTTRIRTSFDRLLTKHNKITSDALYVCCPSVSADKALGDLKAEIISRSPRRGTDQKEVQRETSKPIYRGIPDTPKVTRRGSMDDLLERRGEGDDLLSPEARARINRSKRREKYKTWSGREKTGVADGVALRQSTVDFMAQAKVMEKMERERALRAADEVLARSVVR